MHHLLSRSEAHIRTSGPRALCWVPVSLGARPGGGLQSSSFWKDVKESGVSCNEGEQQVAAPGQLGPSRGLLSHSWQICMR